MDHHTNLNCTPSYPDLQCRCHSYLSFSPSLSTRFQDEVFHTRTSDTSSIIWKGGFPLREALTCISSRSCKSDHIPLSPNRTGALVPYLSTPPAYISILSHFPHLQEDPITGYIFSSPPTCLFSREAIVFMNPWSFHTFIHILPHPQYFLLLL